MMEEIEVSTAAEGAVEPDTGTIDKIAHTRPHLDDVVSGGATLERLSGAVVALTGASGGIGHAAVALLHSAGATVAALDIDLTKVDALASSYPDRVVGIRVDVTEADEVNVAIGAVLKRYGRIDVLINAAGIIHADAVLEVPLATWRRVFSINVEGAMLTSQAAARAMLRQQPSALGRRGLIVNVSSRAARIGRPFSPAYGASKAALDSLTMSLAASLADQGISCMAVYPGDIREGMLSYALPELAKVQGRSFAEVVEERTYQTPEEFAALLVDVVATPGMTLAGQCVRADRVIMPLASLEG